MLLLSHQPTEKSPHLACCPSCPLPNCVELLPALPNCSSPAHLLIVIPSLAAAGACLPCMLYPLQPLCKRAPLCEWSCPTCSADGSGTVRWERWGDGSDRQLSRPSRKRSDRRVTGQRRVGTDAAAGAAAGWALRQNRQVFSVLPRNRSVIPWWRQASTGKLAITSVTLRSSRLSTSFEDTTHAVLLRIWPRTSLYAVR